MNMKKKTKKSPKRFKLKAQEVVEKLLTLKEEQVNPKKREIFKAIEKPLKALLKELVKDMEAADKKQNQ